MASVSQLPESELDGGPRRAVETRTAGPHEPHTEPDLDPHSGEEPPRPHGFPRLKLSLIALAAVLCIVALALYSRLHASGQPAWETARVERGSIQAFITATGNLNPVVNVQVGSQVSGNIQALYADFNTRVTKGQLIAQIDPAIFRAQVEAARAAVRSAEANVAAADAQRLKAVSDAQASRANRASVAAAGAKDQASFVNVQKQWQRARSLLREGVVSSQDADTARANFDAAQAQVQADKAQLEAAGRGIQSADAQALSATAQLGTAMAQLQQTKANLAQASVNLEHTRIVAPVSGTVIARHFDVGQTVAASFQAPDIFDIGEDLTKMQVDTNVDEADVGSVRPGQVATFQVDAYPGITFNCRVGDIRKAPINAQNVITYDIVIVVENPDLKLFPGMTARVTIFTSRQDDVLKVPNASLRFRADPGMKLPAAPGGAARVVYVLDGNSIAAVPVVPGISDGRFTAVTSPSLRAGDTIILRSAATPASGSTPVSSTRRLPGT